jgi:acetolactate synthase I/II/III large subunit
LTGSGRPFILFFSGTGKSSRDHDHHWQIARRRHRAGGAMSGTRPGGRILVDALLSQGVDTVFCVPGESYLPVLDALHERRNRIRLVVCRQEGGAAFMAEAYAKLTGRPGVCFVTRGPGACNGSIGVHTARQDSTPMLYFIGQVPRDQRGREAFQELPFDRVFAPIAKHAEEIDTAARVPEAIARGFRLSLAGRPGPVVLSLPEDMLREEADIADPAPWRAEPAAPGASALAHMRDLLGAAARPLMILGGGGWDEAARADAIAFAEAFDLPVACTFRRQDLFDNRHRCYVGDIGYTLAPHVARILGAADLFLVVGSRFGDIATQGYTLCTVPRPQQTLIHVHPGAEVIGRVYQPTLGIVADASAFMAQAAALTAPETQRNWAGWREEARTAYVADLEPDPVVGAIDMVAVMRDFDAALADDAIVTIGSGNYTGWLNRYFPLGGRRRLIGPANGAMGYGVPAAIAAKLVYPARQVVSVSGDGCFMMNGQELATAAHLGIDPVFIVLDNAMYGTIRAHQEKSYPGRVIGTDLTNPDFAMLAEAYGFHAATVHRTEDFAPAFQAALAAGRAALIRIPLDPEAITTRTSLSALRTTASK